MKQTRLIICAIAVAAITTAVAGALLQPVYQADAVMDPEMDFSSPRVPIATSGDNAYITWWSDKGTPNTNAEVMFRASTDSGQTFGDKINLSNSSDIDSVDQEISAEGDNVFVTWWERNQTSNEPVMRVSNDNGATFGPVLTLATNGTIGEAEEGAEEE